MIVYLLVLPDYVVVRGAGESEAVSADFAEEVRPGGSLLGYTYDELRSLGEGRRDLAPRS